MNITKHWVYKDLISIVPNNTVNGVSKTIMNTKNEKYPQDYRIMDGYNHITDKHTIYHQHEDEK